MRGVSTNPEEDGRKANKGTLGNKGGRPKLDAIRKQHQTRAYDDEWEVIKAFAKLAKENLPAAKIAVDALDKAIHG